MRSELRRALAAIAALCSLATRARESGATPADVFGAGPESQALAGAGATLDTGAEAAFVNPATLADAERSELSLGYHGAIFAIDVDGGDAAGRFPAAALRAVRLGVLAPFRIGEAELAFGLAARSPSNLIVRADVPFPETPQFPILVSRLSALDLNLGLGARLGRALSAGIGVRALASLSGGVAVADDGSGRSRTAVDTELVPAYALTAGLALRLGESWRIAAVFRDALIADFDVRVRAEDLGALALPELHVAGVAHYDPPAIHGEIARRLGSFTLIAAVTYERWSDFPGFLEATTECPASRPACGALPKEVEPLYDTWTPRLGVSYDLELTGDAGASIRAGYAYEPTPLPAQVGSANVWDNTRHVLALGYGVDFEAASVPLFANVAYQLHLLATRRHEKAAGVSPDNAGYPAATIGGSARSFAFDLGARF